MPNLLHAAFASTAALGLASATIAQDAPRVFGALGTEASTHFVLYGEDLHAQGGNWSRPSVFAFTELGLDFQSFDVATGVWFDLRDETGPLGGAIQEVDWFITVGADFDRIRLDVAFEAWHFGIVENVFNVAVAYDDSDMIIENFALNPSIEVHTRLSPGQGTVFVAAIAPEFELDFQNLTIAIPAAIGFGVNDYYADNGYAYASVGLAAAMALDFIPAEYGDWELTASTTYYFTDSDVIGNPRDNFITGAIGLAMSF